MIFGTIFCFYLFPDAGDVIFEPELMYLYKWILHKCQGKQLCDADNSTLPEWWVYMDNISECVMNRTDTRQYFIGIMIEIECLGMYVSSKYEDFKNIHPLTLFHPYPGSMNWK